ncbi:MAG TPA: CpaD family pilus assembly lipoprotein [Stellaceae bacterium]|nr:CpaD family pilus assembly lipoprotein [Stellaceae bacterium]
MLHHRHSARALCVLAALAAWSCTPVPPPPEASGAPLPLRAAPLTHAVHFAPEGDALAPAEGAALAAFLRDAGARPGAAVTVAGGDGPLGAARRARVADTLRRMGLAPKVDAAILTAGRNSVLVMLAQEAAFADAGCVSWPLVGGFDPANVPLRNLGCATDANLYLMVADPRDLVAGREPGPVDAEPGMRAVRVWREGTKPGQAGAAQAAGGADAGGSGASPASPLPAPLTGGTSGQP